MHYPLSFGLVLFFLFSLFYHIPCTSSKQGLEWCETLFQCGNITAGFPFSGGNLHKPCGHPSLELHCNNNITSLFISNQEFYVLQIDQTFKTLTLARPDLLGSFCSFAFNTTTLPPEIFELSPSYKSLTVLYHCDPKLSYRSSYTCPALGLFSMSQSIDYKYSCQGSFTINVPMSFVPEKTELNLTNLESALRKRFEVKLVIDEIPCQECLSSRRGICGFNRTTQICCNVTSPSGGVSCVPYQHSGLMLEDNSDCLKCVNSGGACGYNHTSSVFLCYSRDGSHNHSRRLADADAVTIIASGGILLVILLTGSVLLTGVVTCLVLLCPCFGVQIFRKRKTLDDMRQEKLKALIPLKHYTYVQVKKITKSFAEVVGRGRFGIVYRGTLCDGSMVAVKLLKESKGNDSEDFINEVASMSQTSHVNIVSLLGFCCEGSKRAIIYEFLGNGSLDKFISDKTSMNLDLTTLYGIALGIAHGLQYLHYGCKTRIVHFDIKPQNVLLDENFCPKVSDFGLAKLCEKKESILSLLDTRGTIGYIAPEMISRVYGSVSHKSDVYSYGMLILEMIGAQKKARAHHTSESNPSSMYFPEWIYKDLENGDGGNYIENGINNDEEEVAKKMTLVGLWCIQSSPSNRPSMNRVVEMMEGTLEALEVPPRPVLQQIPAAHLSEYFGISEENSSASEILICSTESSSL